MANYVFNIAKGRMVEFQNRVDQNDPTNAIFIAVPLSASGTEAQGQDLDDLAAVLADPNFTELTTAEWARISFVDTAVPAIAVDDPGNLFGMDLDNVAFGVVNSGGPSTGILICYDSDSGAGTDANIIPISHHDFVATGVGTTITATIPVGGAVTSS